MKKTFYLMAVIVSLILLVSCTSNNSGDEKSMNINPEEIKQITVSTQTNEQKQDIVIESEKIDDLINKLNSYSLREITDEQEKGWQYLFKIEKKGGEITLISFMDKKVKVGDIFYEAKDYNIDDFLYLFK